MVIPIILSTTVLSDKARNRLPPRGCLSHARLGAGRVKVQRSEGRRGLPCWSN